MAPSLGNQHPLITGMRKPDLVLSDVFLIAMVELGRVSPDFTGTTQLSTTHEGLTPSRSPKHHKKSIYAVAENLESNWPPVVLAQKSLPKRWAAGASGRTSPSGRIVEC